MFNFEIVNFRTFNSTGFHQFTVLEQFRISPCKRFTMKTLARVTAILTAFVLFYGCGSAPVEEKTVAANTQQEVKRPISPEMALENFIIASGHEARGEYLMAVNSLLTAYEFDPAPGISYGLAKNYYMLGKLSQALPYAKEAVAKDSLEKEYYYLLADIYTSGRQPDAAEAVISALVKRYPGDYSALYRLANIYEKSKPLSAIEVYLKILEEEPEDWNAYIRLADLYDKTGNKERSTEIIEEFLQYNPSSTELKQVLVNYYISLKKYDKALSHIEGILQIFPDDPGALESKARIFVEQNNFVAASAPYLKLIEAPDTRLDMKLNIGVVYFEKALANDTLLRVADTIFTVVEKDTVNWITHFYKGAIATLLGDTLAAKERFFKVPGDSFLYLQVWQRIGGLVYDAKKYKEAAFIMERAHDNFPDDFLINFFLGLSYALTGDYTASEPFLFKATDLNPNEINTWSAYAFTLSRLKKDTLAVEVYEKALELEPRNTDLLNSLAIVCDGMGNQTKSDSLYTLSLQIDPKNALAANNFAYSLSKRGIRLDEALRLATIALEVDPNSPSYMDTYGWVHFKLGNYDTAKVYIEKALAMDGDNHELLDHYGDVMFKLGNNEEAIVYWRKALEFDKENESIKRKIERGEI